MLQEPNKQYATLDEFKSAIITYQYNSYANKTTATKN